jgi:hypothetical protein
VERPRRGITFSAIHLAISQGSLSHVQIMTWPTPVKSSLWAAPRKIVAKVGNSDGSYRPRTFQPKERVFLAGCGKSRVVRTLRGKAVLQNVAQLDRLTGLNTGVLRRASIVRQAINVAVI